MLQDGADLATYGNDNVCSLVNFSEHFLTGKEKKGITEQWPILHAPLGRQRALKKVDVFSNLFLQMMLMTASY